jgi:hypothetical protein
MAPALRARSCRAASVAFGQACLLVAQVVTALDFLGKMATSKTRLPGVNGPGVNGLKVLQHAHSGDRGANVNERDDAVCVAVVLQQGDGILQGEDLDIDYFCG